MDSLQGHLTELKTAWQVFSNDFLSSSFLKTGVDGLTKIVNIFDKLINTFGTLGTLSAGITIFNLFKSGAIKSGVSYLASLGSALADSTLSFSNFGAAAKMAGADLLSFMKTPTGIATGIGLVTAAIGMAVQAYQKYKQAQREAWQESIDVGNTAKDEADAIKTAYESYSKINQEYHEGASNKEEYVTATIAMLAALGYEGEAIDNLVSDYADADEAYQNGVGSREGLVSAISNLLQGLGYEGEAIDNLIGQYSDLDSIINQVTIDSLTSKLNDLETGYAGAKNALLDVTKDGWFSTPVSLMDWMEDTQEFGQKMGKILEDAGLISSSNYNQGGTWYLGDANTIEGVVEAYNNLIAARQALNDAVSNGTITADELADSGLYNAINTTLARFEDEYNTYMDFVNNMNETQAKVNILDNIGTNGIPQTQSEFDNLRQSIIDASEAGGHFVGTQEQIETAIDSALSSIPSLTQFTNAYSDSLDDTIDETQSKFDELQNTFEDNDVAKWFETLPDEAKQLVYEISLKSDDTTLYTLDRWKTELSSMETTGKTTGEQIQELYKILNSSGDGNISDTVAAYTKNISSLQDALSKIDTGTLTQSDKVNLALDFPELSPYVNDTDALANAIQNLIDTSNQGMNDELDRIINELAESAPEAVAGIEALKEAINGLTNSGTGWNFDLDDEITKFDNLYAAMKESVSGTGLSSKSMANVKSMFQDLDGYDPSKLFERTANGIHMNTTELRNLQAQYEKQKKADIDEHLQSLIDDYHDLQKEIATCTDFTERANKISQLENLQNDITAVADLAAQYEGLTSAYNKWIQAQSAGEEGDMYDSIRSSYGDMQEMYEQGLVGTNAFRTYVDLLSSADLSTAPVDDIISAYERLGQTIEGTSYSAIDFLADGSDGCLNFLHAVQDLNTDWAKMNEDGSWDINFGVGNDKEVADALGIDVEYVQSLMRKLSDYGFDINLDSAYTSIDKLGTYAETANEKLKELGATDIDFNFDTTSIDDVNSQIEEAQSLLDTFKNTDGTVNTSLEGATEAEAVLIALITRKQELSAPSVMSVDTSNANSNIEETIGLLKDFQTNYNDIEIETAVGADTSEAQTNIQSVLTSIDSMPDEVKTSLGLDDADFQAALETLTSTEVDVQAGVNLDTSALETIQSTISGITPEMMVTAGLDSSLIDGYEPPDKSNEVTYSVNDSTVKSYSAPQKTGTVVYNAYMNSWTAPTKYGTVIYTVRTVGSAPSNGTANSLGIGLASGTAFAKGDWGAKKSGVALGGEVGTEIVVRNGKFFTVGEDGAEFFKYKKDDIK